MVCRIHRLPAAAGTSDAMRRHAQAAKAVVVIELNGMYKYCNDGGSGTLIQQDNMLWRGGNDNV